MKESNTDKIKYEEINLYHYTSINALTSIMHNRSLLLTDVRYLNDPKEYQWCLQKFKEHTNIISDTKIKEYIEERIAGLAKYEMNTQMIAGTEGDYFKSITVNTPFRLFVLSLSKLCDKHMVVRYCISEMPRIIFVTFFSFIDTTTYFFKI